MIDGLFVAVDPEFFERVTRMILRAFVEGRLAHRERRFVVAWDARDRAAKLALVRAWFALGAAA